MRGARGGQPGGDSDRPEDGSDSTVAEHRYARAAARELSRHAADIAVVAIDDAGRAADVQAIGDALRRRARARLLVLLTITGTVIAALVALTLLIFFCWP